MRKRAAKSAKMKVDWSRFIVLFSSKGGKRMLKQAGNRQVPV